MGKKSRVKQERKLMRMRTTPDFQLREMLRFHEQITEEMD